MENSSHKMDYQFLDQVAVLRLPLEIGPHLSSVGFFANAAHRYVFTQRDGDYHTNTFVVDSIHELVGIHTVFSALPDLDALSILSFDSIKQMGDIIRNELRSTSKIQILNLHSRLKGEGYVALTWNETYQGAVAFSDSRWERVTGDFQGWWLGIGDLLKIHVRQDFDVLAQFEAITRNIKDEE